MDLSKKPNPVKSFFKGVSNTLKHAAWLLGIQIIISLFSIVLITDKENPSDIIKALSLVMLASAVLIMFFLSKTNAYYDFEIYKNNIIRRKRKDEVPRYRTMMEYRPYKGLLAGLISVLPSLILAVIGITGSHLVNQSNIFGTIAMLINFVYTIPVLNFGGANSLYFVFAGCAVQVLSAGAGYYLHGEKLRLQYEELNKGRKCGL